MPSTVHDNPNMKKGFTLIEMLIAVALIAILATIGIPLLSSQLEKSREAADLANVRSAYAEVMVAAIMEDTSSSVYDSFKDEYTKTVYLTQKEDGWVTNTDSLTIGGVEHSDSVHWKGDAKAEGTCVVTYDYKGNDITLNWGRYTVYPNFQWWKKDGKFVSDNKSYNTTNWPCSALAEFVPANVGQKVVVDQITEESYPTLYAWLKQGGGYEIGIFTVAMDGSELHDTGGQYIYSNESREFTVIADTQYGVEDGADVQLAIQFFKMNSGTDHGRGSTVMTEKEARELERIFKITDAESESGE